MSKLPPAARFITYPGDTRGNLRQRRGPNTLGEPLTIVSEEYDPDTNTTRVGFSFAFVVLE